MRNKGKGRKEEEERREGEVYEVLYELRLPRKTTRKNVRITAKNAR